MQTLVIGAGPAGLAAAMELMEAQVDFLVMEKTNAVGGLAKTYSFEEDGLIFRTDNGPHRFFSKNPRLYAFMERILGEQWIEVRRETRQFIAGKFYDYPVNPAQALANIGPVRAARMLADYCTAQIRYGLMRKPIRNFEDHIVAHFGRTLGAFNMLNYTEKIWGVPPRTIHADWARQRIKGLSVGFLMKAAVERARGAIRTKPLRTLTDSFYYPEYGSGSAYEKIASLLAEKGRPVMLNAFPVRIAHDNSRITEVEVEQDGTRFVVRPKTVIQSVPPPAFLALLDPSPPERVMEAARAMRYRDQVYLFLTLDRPRVTGDQWIYFPESHIPFGRVSEMRNFSPKMSPSGKTSLFIEFFCFEGDRIWNMEKEGLVKCAMEWLERLGFCSRNDLRASYLMRRKRAYPIYDVAYKEYLGTVMEYLDGFENMHPIGRPGRFRYNNQDHSIEMGIEAARGAMTRTKPDFDRIGGEGDYYENAGREPFVDARKLRSVH